MTNEQAQNANMADALGWSRDQCIEWLCWNDHNGTYTDQGCLDEDMQPLTEEQARFLAMSQILESIPERYGPPSIAQLVDDVRTSIVRSILVLEGYYTIYRWPLEG